MKQTLARTDCMLLFTSDAAGRLCPGCDKPMDVMWVEDVTHLASTGADNVEFSVEAVCHCWHCDIDMRVIKTKHQKEDECITTRQRFFFG